MTIGLALSGGGSRAAAFHRGTLQGLIDLGLLRDVASVSTVSGGSLFGGAWLAARARGEGDDAFLAQMHAQLRKGFVLRALLHPRAVKIAIPFWSNRTDVLGELFDGLFFRSTSGGSLTLADLPATPKLCVNVSILDDAQVGKFHRGGFSSRVVSSTHTAFRLSRAVVASAAFPVGLPPIWLSRKRDLGSAAFRAPFESRRGLSLTDGGVLENLGVQSLLQGRFESWDLVVSDAGTKEKPWKANALLGPLKSAGIAVLSGGALDKVLLMMNDKQNRWMRQYTMQKVLESWSRNTLGGYLGSGEPPKLQAGMRRWLGGAPPDPRRRLLFVRVNQTYQAMLESLAGRENAWRLAELYDRAHPGQPLPDPLPQSAPDIECFLREKCGVDLSRATALYAQLGGEAKAEAMNDVSTHFSALSEATLRDLSLHAQWQVHAAHALYWK